MRFVKRQNANTAVIQIADLIESHPFFRFLVNVSLSKIEFKEFDDIVSTERS